jgi:hypothetical protein
MKAEDHLEAHIEHRKVIFNWALDVEGLKKSQRIVGLHASRGIVKVLSAYLHESGRITPGHQLNHRWFKNEKIEEKLPEFPEKEEVVKKMVKLEISSENLAYGSPKNESEIREVLGIFRGLEEIINSLREGEHEE